MWATMLWQYKTQILYGIAAVTVAALLWWGFIHNPKVIKRQEQELIQKDREIEAGKAAINLIQSIEAAHRKTEEERDENIKRIRNGRKPGRNGVFVLDGVLPQVYKAYTTAN